MLIASVHCVLIWLYGLIKSKSISKLKTWIKKQIYNFKECDIHTALQYNVYEGRVKCFRPE